MNLARFLWRDGAFPRRSLLRIDHAEISLKSIDPSAPLVRLTRDF
jgi:hypothetical protein